MFHWCPQETAALLAVLGLLPFIGTWLRTKLSKRHCCEPSHVVAVTHTPFDPEKHRLFYRNEGGKKNLLAACPFPGCIAPNEYPGHIHPTGERDALTFRN